MWRVLMCRHRSWNDAASSARKPADRARCHRSSITRRGWLAAKKFNDIRRGATAHTNVLKVIAHSWVVLLHHARMTRLPPFAPSPSYSHRVSTVPLLAVDPQAAFSEYEWRTSQAQAAPNQRSLSSRPQRSGRSSHRCFPLPCWAHSSRRRPPPESRLWPPRCPQTRPGQ